LIIQLFEFFYILIHKENFLLLIYMYIDLINTHNYQEINDIHL